MDCIEHIQEILNQSQGEFYIRGKPVHKIDNLYINLWKDESNNYLNGLQYIKQDDLFWHMSNPEEFINKYLNDSNKLKVNVTKRLYGQPKLSKPSELKGVKQAFSVDYIPEKARCQIFVIGNDVWIKHVDWFSSTLQVPPEELGAPLGYLANKYLDKQRGKKFVYGDSWGSIVLRNEAWVHIQGLLYRLKMNEFELDLLQDIMKQIEHIEGFSENELACSDMEGFSENELACSDMERFMENVIGDAKKYMKRGL